MAQKTQETIASETMERIKKEKEANKSLEVKEAEAKAKKEEEARDASKVTPPKEEKTKEEQETEAKAQKEKEAIETIETAEAQVKEDTRILETQDDKLNDKEKVRKVELKKNAAQRKIDKRIGELTSKITILEKSGTAKNGDIADLKKKVEELKKPPEVDEGAELKKAEQGRIKKYLEDDKDKPRAERREMTKEELDEWLQEDYVEAQDWMVERKLRRRDETKHDQYKSYMRKKQQESFERSLEKNPKLDVRKVVKRSEALKKEGKSNDAISEAIAEEYPECAMVFIVAEEMPELMRKPNGPELVAEEVGKRMKAKSPKVKKEEEEAEKKKKEDKEKAAEDTEFDEKVDAEIERRAKADEAAGIESSRAGEHKEEGEKSDIVKTQEKLGKRVGMSAEKLKKARQRIKDREAGNIV